jgi:hypothetical protein
MNTLSLNYKEISITDGEYTHSHNWCEVMQDSDYLEEKDCWISFVSNGFEVTVDFDFSVSASSSYCPGDYYTPPESTFEITSVDIDVKSMEIDGYNVPLTNELIDKLKKLIDISL